MSVLYTPNNSDQCTNVQDVIKSRAYRLRGEEGMYMHVRVFLYPLSKNQTDTIKNTK